jgi:hypothetical protein
MSTPPPGLCAECRHRRVVRSKKGSVFTLCEHPALPKYPALPVMRCDGFARQPD